MLKPVTPTTAADGGVNPICTAEPACPFHEVSYADALAKGPVAMLVGTPTHCSTGICGRARLVWKRRRSTPPGYVHAGVHRRDDQGDPPTVQALQLTFEPSLFLVHADGTLAQRIDVIYDADELDAALTALTT
jgi:hypothetical protein